MTQTFSATIDDWVRETEARLLAVFRTAAQYVIEDVQMRTPVDTGFLRASLAVQTGDPAPMSRKSDDGSTPPAAYDLAIAGADLGDTLYATFTAVYAARLEYGFNGEDKLGRSYKQEGAGMVRLAAQDWPQHVQRATAEAKARVAANARSS